MVVVHFQRLWLLQGFAGAGCCLVGCCKGRSVLAFFVGLYVEVHEEAEENRGVEQQQAGNEFGELALLAEEGANGVNDAENELSLKEM